MSANPGCSACRDGKGLDFPISMAFQPIVDLQRGQVFAHEALVRGSAGESAGSLLARIDSDNRYAFDQSCRIKAVEWAARLQVPAMVSINFMPNAVYRAETCIRATLEAAARCNFPLERIIFEVTEQEQVLDIPHLTDILRAYRKQGFMTAIDDFGAGYAGLNLLAEFQPHVLKLDMALTRGIDQDPVRQAIVAGIVLVASRLNIRIVAEGIESAGERDALRELGIRYMQGFLFARPALDRLCLP